MKGQLRCSTSSIYIYTLSLRHLLYWYAMMLTTLRSRSHLPWIPKQLVYGVVIALAHGMCCVDQTVESNMRASLILGSFPRH